ncbi:hypothetical protein [Herbidospora yilanensis]|uniref:hypothetical protein n=1 Tax=Herbidospora yilanensis TaxID=354426 RepID=UPI000783BF60|nr:hypothetical protein [Herbidospora yilanensis]
MEALARDWDNDLDGPRPGARAPAASVWLPLLEHRAKEHGWRRCHGATRADRHSPPIAMPRPTARTPGRPREPIEWRELVPLPRWPGVHGRRQCSRDPDEDDEPIRPGPRPPNWLAKQG